jgi:hypothetical protein
MKRLGGSTMDEMVGEAHTRFLCRDCGELFYDETAFNQHFVLPVPVSMILLPFF